MPLLLGHLDRLLSFLRAVEGEKGEGQALPGGEGLGGDLAARATWWGRLVYWGHEGVCPRRAEAGGTGRTANPLTVVHPVQELGRGLRGRFPMLAPPGRMQGLCVWAGLCLGVSLWPRPSFPVCFRKVWKARSRPTRGPCLCRDPGERLGWHLPSPAVSQRCPRYGAC